MISHRISIANKLSSSYIMIGFFLINWSYISFFLGGSILKTVLLLLGVTILSIFLFQRQVKYSSLIFRISFFSFIYYTLLVLYTNIMQHNISINLVMFGYLNCLLFLVGALISNNIDKILLPRSFIIKILLFLVIVGTVYYFLKGNIVRLDDNEDLYSSQKDSGINRVGLGYTNLIIFFIFYNLIGFYNKTLNKAIFFILIIIVVQLFNLQARGVLIYLILILILSNLSKFSRISSISKAIKNILLILIVLIILYSIISNYFPSYLEILNGTLERFEGIEGLFNSEKTLDLSALERKKFIDFFFDNYNEFIFTGIKNYSPYPHNIFIEIIERFGVILGFPILFSILFTSYKAFKIVYKNKKDDILINIFSMIYLYTFFQAFTSFNLENNRSLWISMAVVLFFNKQNK